MYCCLQCLVVVETDGRRTLLEDAATSTTPELCYMVYSIIMCMLLKWRLGFFKWRETRIYDRNDTVELRLRFIMNEEMQSTLFKFLIFI